AVLISLTWATFPASIAIEEEGRVAENAKILLFGGGSRVFGRVAVLHPDLRQAVGNRAVGLETRGPSRHHQLLCARGPGRHDSPVYRLRTAQRESASGLDDDTSASRPGAGTYGASEHGSRAGEELRGTVARLQRAQYESGKS